MWLDLFLWDVIYEIYAIVWNNRPIFIILRFAFLIIFAHPHRKYIINFTRLRTLIVNAWESPFWRHYLPMSLSVGYFICSAEQMIWTIISQKQWNTTRILVNKCIMQTLLMLMDYRYTFDIYKKQNIIQSHLVILWTQM